MKAQNSNSSPPTKKRNSPGRNPTSLERTSILKLLKSLHERLARIESESSKRLDSTPTRFRRWLHILLHLTQSNVPKAPHSNTGKRTQRSTPKRKKRSRKRKSLSAKPTKKKSGTRS